MGARALLALVPLLLAAVVASGAPATASTGVAARAAAPGTDAGPSVVRRCRTVRVKLKRGGKVVKRKGKPVFRRVRRCKKVPSPGCRFVKKKKRRNGKVVKRKGKPVYIKVERCPPKPKPKPPAPGPQPGPGPGTTANLANRVLALAQRQPGDINIFASNYPNGAQGLYPQGSAMTPAAGPAPTNDQVRTRLTAYLNRYFENDATRVNAALAVFDDADVKALCDGTDDQDATLRAALAASAGTVYEPAVEYGLNGGAFQLIRYGTLPDTSFIAGSTGGATGRVVTVNSRYSAESFEYLIGVMGHEFMHHNFETPRAEEAVLNAMSAMGHMQVLSEAPELAHGRTELSRNINDLVLAFVNSREAGSPDSEIYATTGRGVAPGGPFNVRDFWTLLRGTATVGEAPAALRTMLVALMKPGTAIPAAPDYSQATAELFAQLGDTWLTDTQRAQISVLLELVTVAEIAQATGLGQQQIIDTLGLQPYLDAIN